MSVKAKPIAGISPSQEAVITSMFCPVTPVACNVCPLVIVTPKVFLTPTIRSLASAAKSENKACEALVAVAAYEAETTLPNKSDAVAA
jgi:hypothetical protein